LRLREKQRLKRMTGVLEKPMRVIYERANQLSGSTGENILRLMELRLDNVLRRVGLAGSLRFARQMVNHGHINVNGKRATISSHTLKVGDHIQVRENMRENFFVKLSLESFGRRGGAIPSWIAWDGANWSAQILRNPEANEFSYPITDQYIVEFYTRR
jgi:small subunit ribosomal protein S4